MPGGIEMLLEAEQHLDLNVNTRLLSIACGTGELELYLAEKYGCTVTGVDVDERGVSRARDKAALRGLEAHAQFEIGDGNALRFPDQTFDTILCSGALWPFYDNGLREFRRLLVPGGRAAILDVVWLCDAVPKDVVQCWTEGEATVLTREGNIAAFGERGFQVIHAATYHEPAWWQAYYDDRGDAPHWQEEHASYRAHQSFLGVGLFILQREPC